MTRIDSSAAIVALALAPCLFPPAAGEEGAPGVDWPRFLGPTGDAKSPEGPVPTTWPEGGPPLAWYLETGEGYSAPSIAEGRLFHFDRLGDRARLLALKARTGEEIWRSEYPADYEDYYGYNNGPRATPVVDGDRVYTLGVQGRLRCHRVETGELLWEVDTNERFGVVQNFFGVGSTPVIEGPLLIAMIGGSPPGSPAIHSGEVRGDGSGIVAFDKLTGEVLYAVTDELASYASPRIATIGDRRYGFAFTRGGLLAFEPATGEVDFFYPWKARILESVNASTPVVQEDTVLISECYGPGSSLLRVRPDDGYEVVWRDERRRNQILQTHWNTPVLHEGHVYASSGRNTGNAELRCIEHATGEVRWSRPGLRRATLLYLDDHLLVWSEQGVLRLIEATPEEYRPVAEVDLGRVSVEAADGSGERPLIRYPAWQAPVLSHGLLYLRGSDTLVALELISRQGQRQAAPGAPGR